MLDDHSICLSHCIAASAEFDSARDDSRVAILQPDLESVQINYDTAVCMIFIWIAYSMSLCRIDRWYNLKRDTARDDGQGCVHAGACQENSMAILPKQSSTIDLLHLLSTTTSCRSQ